MSLMDSVGKFVSAVSDLYNPKSDFWAPKAVAGKVVDPMRELELPARPELGMRLTADLTSSIGAAGGAMMGSGPLLALLPPTYILKSVVDGQHVCCEIAEDTLQRIRNDLDFQMAVHGEIQEIPDISAIPREPASRR